MSRSSKACACLAALLLLAPGTPAAAAPQSSASGEPGGTAAQAAPGSGQQTEGTRRRRPRESRRKKRTPRQSPRQASGPSSTLQKDVRPSRDAGPTRQDLALVADVAGGYDDNLTTGLGSGRGIAPVTMTGGTIGYLAGTLNYLRGNNLRAIRVDSTGRVAAYPGHVDHPPAGATASVEAKTAVGGQLTLRGTQRISYEPFFTLLSTDERNGAVVDVTPDTWAGAGLFVRRSLNSHSSVFLEHPWGYNHTTSLSYSYDRREFKDADRASNASHGVSLGHRAILATGFGMRAEYRYMNGENRSNQHVLPTRRHRIEAGPEMEFEFSRNRHLNLSLSAGAGYLGSVRFVTREPFHSWIPTGSAQAIIGLSPSWSAGAGYQRDFALLQTITDKVYATNSAFLDASGLLTPRMGLGVGATYTNWQTPLASGASDTFRVYAASAEVRVGVTTTVSVSVAYNYYFHRYSNPGALPAGFPGQYDRNAIRLGMTIWLPVAGASPPPQLVPRRNK